MPLSEHVLQVRFPNRQEALSLSRAAGAGLEVFVPSGQRPPIGRQVKLWVSFDDASEEFELLGRVAFLRGPSKEGAPAGVGVSFDGEAKRAAAEMLAFCAGAPLEDVTGVKARRVPAQIPCRIEVGDQKFTGEVADLSATGVFVACPKLPRFKVGTKVHIRFKAGLLSWSPPLEARLMWHGEKRGKSGFGARFSGDSSVTAKEVRPFLLKSG